MWNMARFYGGYGKREIVIGHPVAGFAASRRRNLAFGRWLRGDKGSMSLWFQDSDHRIAF